MWRGEQSVRQPLAPVAAPPDLPVQDDSGRRCPTGSLPGARGQDDERSVVGSRFGLHCAFEALIIDWLQEATISAVARQLDVTWDQVSGVMERAVRRGLARRDLKVPRRIGVDETSFQKRHEYVTVVADLETGCVQYVTDGHKKGALGAYYDSFSEGELGQIESVAMDMWGPYISDTLAALPDANEKIAFDKFHVAMHLGKAVDQVRRAENRALFAVRDKSLIRHENTA